MIYHCRVVFCLYNVTVVQQHSNQFLHYINSIDPHIQITMENPKENVCILFLSTLVSHGPNNTLTISVYKKPNHTDQYLHWDSNHNLLAKYLVSTTSRHRMKVVCTNQIQLMEEDDNIRQALLRYNNPIGP